MPTLDDIPTLPTCALSGNEFLPVSDPDAKGGTQVGKLPVNAVLGLAATDVATDSNTARTIDTRLTVFTNTSAVTATLPLAAGNLREVIILKGSGTSAVTVSRAGTDVIVSGANVSATSVTLNLGTAARFLSDGTKWYHVSNDVV